MNAPRLLVTTHGTRIGTIRVNGAVVRLPGTVPEFGFVTLTGSTEEVRVRRTPHVLGRWKCDRCGPQHLPECAHAIALKDAIAEHMKGGNRKP